MDIEQAIHKATLLLDLKNDVSSAETLLREAVAEARLQEDVIGQARAGLFLGELLLELKRSDEALPFLRTVAQLESTTTAHRDVLNHEIARAKTLLDSIGSELGSTLT